MKILDRREQEELRLELAQMARIPSSSIQLDTRGNFHIYNVRENDSQMIVSNLRRLEKVVQVSRSPSGYNFGHFDRYFQPEQKYTINGVINID